METVDTVTIRQAPALTKEVKAILYELPSAPLCIECGAHDGVGSGADLSHTDYLEQNLNATCINIEPVPSLFLDLVRNRPRSENYQAIITPFENADFTVVTRIDGQNTGLSSMENPREALPVVHRKEGLDECVTRYKDFDFCLKGRSLDLLCLDVEGHEEHLLRAIFKADPLFLIIEINKMPEWMISVLCKVYQRIHWNDVNGVFYKRED